MATKRPQPAAEKPKTYPTIDELVARVKKLEPKPLHEYEHSYVEKFPDCCGINVLTDVNGVKLDAEWLAATVAASYTWSGYPAGYLFVSDNKPRKDFEALGFELYKTFKNPKTRRTIYTYGAKWADTLGKLDKKLAQKKATHPYGKW